MRFSKDDRVYLLFEAKEIYFSAAARLGSKEKNCSLYSYQQERNIAVCR